MIRIKKIDRNSIDMYLTEEDSIFLLQLLLNKKTEKILLDSRSVGFKNKKIEYLIVEKTTSKSSVKQYHNELILGLDDEDIEYFIFRLEKYIETKQITPPELFNLDYTKNNDTVYLYLKTSNE